MGRHSSSVTGRESNRRVVYLTAVGLLVLSLAALLIVRPFGSKVGAGGVLSGVSCDNPTAVDVRATADFQPVLEAAAKMLAAKGGKDGVPCLQFNVTAAPASKVAQDLATAATVMGDRVARGGVDEAWR